MTFKTLFTATAAAVMLMASQALADVTASNPWARDSAGMANAGAAFMMLKNNGANDDVLVAAKADVAKRIELHTHLMENGVMKMREVEGGIPVPAGGVQMLQPGGYHVMLMGLNAPLEKGSTFPLTLIFKSGQELTVTVEVKAASAMGTMNHGHMDHDHMDHGMQHGHDMKDMDHDMGHGKKMGH